MIKRKKSSNTRLKELHKNRKVPTPEEFNCLLEKALEFILEFSSKKLRFPMVEELAKHLNIPVKSLHRGHKIIATLVERGFVRKVGRYNFEIVK